MNQIAAQTESSLRAARAGAVYRVLDAAGVVRINGETRFDYLQRQTSNDMQLLKPDRALPNILTSPKGRILEIFTVLDEGNGYNLLTPPGRGEPLVEYFQKRIFFNDQVAVSDASQHWAQLELHGPEAAARLAAVTDLGHAPAPQEVIGGRFDGKPLKVIGKRGLGASLGFRLLLPIQAFNALLAALEGEGAEALDDEGAEILRLEAGLPAWGKEIKEDYTPLEVGLAERVSGDKGCYTGQEVLARQLTYDKVTKQLARLQFEQPVTSGAKVTVEGKTAGAVTSAVASPRLGPIGLAVLRRPYHIEGSELTVVDGEEEIGARVTAV